MRNTDQETGGAVLRAHETTWNGKAGIGRSRVWAGRKSSSQMGYTPQAVGSHGRCISRGYTFYVVWLLCIPGEADANRSHRDS